MNCAPSTRLRRLLGVGENEYTLEGWLAYKVVAAALEIKSRVTIRVPHSVEIMKQGIARWSRPRTATRNI
jgi:hypothetical protein